MAHDTAGPVRRSVAPGIPALVLCLLVLTGCGSSSLLLHRSSARSTVRVAPGIAAGDVRVIKGWADALRSGHVVAAARYFRIPSIFFTGNGPPVELASLWDVEHVNAALPCGARLLAVTARGRYLDALFRLGNRPGPGGAQGCGSGTGQTARTDFLIRDGHIVQWLRAPDEPGDPGTPRPGPGGGPATPPGGATTPSGPSSTI